MKDKLIRIVGALALSGLMYGAVNFVGAQEGDLPITPPVTPSVTVTPTTVPSVTPTVTPTVTPSVTPTVTPSVSPSVTPTPKPASAGHTTGGVWAKLGNETLKLNFNAASSLKGNMNYSSSNGDKFVGKVNVCYTQSGNQAAFAGLVGKGNVHNLYFLIRVQDNGEGKKKTGSDKVGIWFSDALPTCTIGDAPALVTNGNIQVHK